MACLLAALLQQDPVLDALSYLIRHRDPDGIWDRPPLECRCSAPPAPGGTGRVALAFLSLGYGPLSKDEIAGVQVGRLLDVALSSLQTGQREDGALYPEDPTANAWAAWALAEVHTLTG